MASFRLCRHKMGTSERKLTNAMGMSLLADKLRGVNELRATFALWAAGQSTDLNALTQAIESIQAEYLDEIKTLVQEAHKNCSRSGRSCKCGTSSAASVKAGGEGKKGKAGKGGCAKVTYTFCGKPNCKASECWNNPQSTACRPQFAQKAAPPSNPPGLATASPSNARLRNSLLRSLQVQLLSCPTNSIHLSLCSACDWRLGFGLRRFAFHCASSQRRRSRLGHGAVVSHAS